MQENEGIFTIKVEINSHNHMNIYCIHSITRLDQMSKVECAADL